MMNLPLQVTSTCIDAPNKVVPGANGVDYAYRELGEGAAAHGFLFQHHGEFAADVAAFLDDEAAVGPKGVYRNTDRATTPRKQRATSPRCDCMYSRADRHMKEVHNVVPA
jgi:hypothetical protein